ncbi:MAG: hypothetical protein A2831_01380 [Candidatus Yanofskybacteria bacterium RIFCSPHIGHO2_01_FULL_44_17]|uniref:Uncharacterized protein n=1 Tax=Candidatus Yanofskybacteria bacterium RIFCSPHIGHO2_01_FULL_44_17 TaxID=1802668 RepID=A0A1F8EZL7_9BACT|nr:MAG: hypothetical protein A2831_01380 [Candidatus Yanofskybacteria bacterium RIFCSPHIGHO2_01_FULL_44_17]
MRINVLARLKRGRVATAKPTAEPIPSKKIAVSAVAAVALILGRGLNKAISFKFLCELLYVLKYKNGFDIDIQEYFGQAPGNSFFSEDIDRFLGGLASAGYMPSIENSRSQIKLEKRGFEVCERVIIQELQEDPVQFLKLGDAIVPLVLAIKSSESPA